MAAGGRWLKAMPSTVIHKEMGLTHTDFYRDIERVLGVGNFQKTDNGVIADQGDKRLQIVLSEQSQRKIALIVLPVTHLTFTFENYGEADLKAVMDLFDRVFRRGGG